MVATNVMAASDAGKILYRSVTAKVSSVRAAFAGTQGNSGCTDGEIMHDERR